MKEGTIDSFRFSTEEVFIVASVAPHHRGLRRNLGMGSSWLSFTLTQSRGQPDVTWSCFAPDEPQSLSNTASDYSCYSDDEDTQSM